MPEFKQIKVNKNDLINTIITTYYSINCIEFFSTSHQYHQGKYIIDSIKPNVAILEELQLLTDFLADTHKKIESLTKKIPLIQSSIYDDGPNGIKHLGARLRHFRHPLAHHRRGLLL